MFIESQINSQRFHNDDYRRATFAPLMRKYDTSTVVAAGARRASHGEGSGIQDAAMLAKEFQMGEQDRGFLSWLGTSLFSGSAVERALEQELVVPIAEEDWKNSNFFREGLEYEEGLTLSMAQIMADRKDMLDTQDFILERATGWQTGAGFIGQAAGSIADVKNLYYSLAAAAVVATGVGAVGVALGAAATIGGRGAAAALTTTRGANLTARAMSRNVSAAQAAAQGTFKARVGVITAEALLATTPMSLGAIDTSSALQENYTAQDAFMDLSASVLLSVGIHAVGTAAGRGWNRFKTANEDSVVGEVLASQVLNGERADVVPLIMAQMSQKTIPLTTLAPDALRSPTVIKKGKQFEAFYPGEDGLFAATRGKGKTQEAAVAELEGVYNSVNSRDLYGIETTKQLEELLGYKPSPEWFDTIRTYGNNLQALNSFDSAAQINSNLQRTSPGLAKRLSETESELMQVKLGRADAEDRLNAARTDAERALEQDSVTKLSRKEQKMVDRLKDIKQQPAYRTAAAKVSDTLRPLKELDNALRKNLIQIQSDGVRPRYQEWVRRQTSANPADRRAGEITDSSLPTEPVKLNDSMIESKMQSAAADNKAEITRALDDEAVPAERKAFIREELSQVEDANLFVRSVEDFINCLGGRRG